MKSQARLNTQETNHSDWSGIFSESLWFDLTDKLAKVFSLDRPALADIRSNAVLKLVGALPYLADCDEPERTALAHMSIFVLAGHPATKPVFSHNFKDSASLEKRLEPVSHFSSGNPEVIDWGMKLLMIAMIQDHLHDAEEDLEAGKMNPINAGHWDGKELIEQIRCDMPQLTDSKFVNLMTDVELQTWWAR